jgi:hypothetical protein
MGAEANSQRTAGLKPWQPGQSGNPGGMPKGTRARLNELQASLTLAHGGKVLTALQKLFEMGTDERTYTAADKRGEPVEVPVVEAKIRVAALNAFVTGVGNLSGWANAAKAPEQEQPVADEAELLGRVVESVVRRDPALVAAKLALVKP